MGETGSTEIHKDFHAQNWCVGLTQEEEESRMSLTPGLNCRMQRELEDRPTHIKRRHSLHKLANTPTPAWHFTIEHWHEIYSRKRVQSNKDKIELKHQTESDDDNLTFRIPFIPNSNLHRAHRTRRIWRGGGGFLWQTWGPRTGPFELRQGLTNLFNTITCHDWCACCFVHVHTTRLVSPGPSFVFDARSLKSCS